MLERSGCGGFPGMHASLAAAAVVAVDVAVAAVDVVDVAVAVVAAGT